MPITPCVNTPPTPGIVSFDPVAFVASFPMFTSVPGAALTGNFSLATLMIDNSCCSVVKDAPTRAQLLNLATAHITALLNGVNGDPPQGIVGRVNSANEGSVSVQTEMLQQSESAAYWQQSPWGALFWMLTLKYRSARYIAPLCGPWGSPWNAWPQ